MSSSTFSADIRGLYKNTRAQTLVLGQATSYLISFLRCKNNFIISGLLFHPDMFVCLWAWSEVRTIRGRSLGEAITELEGEKRKSVMVRGPSRTDCQGRSDTATPTSLPCGPKVTTPPNPRHPRQSVCLYCPLLLKLKNGARSNFLVHFSCLVFFPAGSESAYRALCVKCRFTIYFTCVREQWGVAD